MDPFHLSSRADPIARWVWSALFGLAMIPGPPASAAPVSCSMLSGTTVRLIVPHNPAGGYDAYARLLQPFLERELHATVVVENRSGAGGLVGAAAIRDAKPDGRTLGILNAAGLLAAGLEQDVPDPIADFTILARLLSNRTVLVTGSQSNLRNLDDLLKLSAQRPVVIGVRDAGSASIFTVAVVASLIGLKYELVNGYDSNSARALAAIRGEVDLLVQNLDSVQRFIADGELRPLLQVVGTRPGAAPGPNEQLLSNVPVLGGAAGVAQDRAKATGRTRQQALQQADALAALIDAGRLIAAPPHLPDSTRRCLESTLDDLLVSPAFAAAARQAKLSIEPAPAVEARADLVTATRSIAQFAPQVKAAMQRTRQ